MKNLTMILAFLVGIIGCSKSPISSIKQGEETEKLSIETTVPSEDTVGNTINIEWSATEGSDVNISPQIGDVNYKGSAELKFESPGEKYINFTVEKNRQSLTKVDTIQIFQKDSQKLPTVLVTTTDTVKVGEEATIEWKTKDANRVEVTHVSNPALNGEKQVSFSSSGNKVIKAEAYNDAGSTIDRDTIVVIKESSGDPEPINVTADATVTVVEGSQVIYEAAGGISIEQDGYYRITATVNYDGDSEKNESYFLQAKDPQGNVRGPQNPNLVDLYKIIEDDGESSDHQSKRKSGIFRMTEGTNYIELHHYSEIAQNHPDYKNGDFGSTESVHVVGFRLEYVGAL